MARYPVSLDLEAPLRIARWRPLVQWLLAIPHFVVLYALGFVQFVLWIVAFVAVVFTASIPEGLFGFMTTVHRYQWRVTSYAIFMRQAYPRFEFLPNALDPGDDPARLSIEYPARMSRFLPFVKWFLAIPHYFVLTFVEIAYLVVLLAAFVAVLVTGSWPEALRRFLVGVTRWTMRVQAYVYLLTDQYPPFSLK